MKPRALLSTPTATVLAARACVDYGRVVLTARQNLDAFDGFDGRRAQAITDSFHRRFNPEGL